MIEKLANEMSKGHSERVNGHLQSISGHLQKCRKLPQRTTLQNQDQIK